MHACEVAVIAIHVAVGVIGHHLNLIRSIRRFRELEDYIARFAGARLQRQPDHAFIALVDAIQSTSPLHTIGFHCVRIKDGTSCRTVRSLAAQLNVVRGPVLRFYSA